MRSRRAASWTSASSRGDIEWTLRPKQQRLTMILSAAILNPFRGDPWRILFAFDPNRAAILLVGGNKRGDKRWYKKHLPIADERFREHLDRLQQ